MSNLQDSVLFTPYRLGQVTLRNRTIRSAAFESMGKDFSPTQQLKDYHVSVARGGIGMTTLAYAAVCRSGLSFKSQLWLRPEIVPALRDITDAIHKEGAAASISREWSPTAPPPADRVAGAADGIRGGAAATALGTALDNKPILTCSRGETSPVGKVKGFNAAVEKMFDFAGKRVRAGLLTPTMNLSYGGEMEEMRKLPGYERLRETCTEHNVEVFESFMGLSGLVNVGKGAMVLGFASEPHKFE